MATLLLADDGERRRLIVDGVDLTEAIQAFAIRYSPDDVTTRFEVELVLDEIQVGLDGEPAELLLPDATKELLVKYGWAPPK